MPELPEVETVVCDLLAAKLVGIPISSVAVFWPRTVATPGLKEFGALLQEKVILGVQRRAKWVILTLSGGYFLCIHLRMTGRFSFVESPHVRIALTFQDGRILFYHDPRKFGRFWLTQELKTVTGKLGPEPLDELLSDQQFMKALKSKKRQLKPLLLDQAFLAGLGNIYVDEALWEAKLHPQRLSHSLTAAESKSLLKAIRHVLQRGLRTQGTSLGKGKSNFYRLDGSQGKHQDAMQVFRRTGLPCPRCGLLIQRILVAQRSTHVCLNCQTL